MTSASPASSGRFFAIDAARGLAVVAMVAYHFTWDLWFFGLIGADLLGDPLWLAARTAIVSSFLFIAGVCAVAPSDAAATRRRFIRL
ncbi:MAG TPA: heparan-alpha-glucosaminide N-acetyltransferase domain-containing protein, partial [Azospirillaceae bacterium]|nr:heparan-alpha-glucosaminide N-acetyltransferase domain-containing protein [Azospirillaceae bacterium]